MPEATWLELVESARARDEEERVAAQFHRRSRAFT